MHKHLTIKLLLILLIAMFGHLFFVKGHIWPVNSFDWLIISNIRLPRTLLGAVTGFILAVTGAVFQKIFNNRLADSFTLGIASGASLGSALGVITGLSTMFLSITVSLVTLIAVVILTKQYFSSQQRIGMILFGMFINFFCSSALYGLVVFSPGKARQLLNYLFGSIGTAESSDIIFLIPITLSGTLILMKFSRAIQIISSGEIIARGAGINEQRVTYFVLIVSSFMTAVLISITGVIGFVGLIIPQLFKQTQPLLSIGIAGSIAVLAADFLGHNMLMPIQMPVSVPLSLLGLPLLLLMMLKKEFKGGL